MAVNISKLMGVSKLDYLNYHQKQYNSWCEKHANMHLVPVRVFQKDETLYNWYCRNWELRIEKVFLQDNNDYIIAEIVDPTTYFILFKDAVETPLLDIYPVTIINQIKKHHYDELRKIKAGKANQEIRE